MEGASFLYRDRSTWHRITPAVSEIKLRFEGCESGFRRWSETLMFFEEE
jgi:predicted YcjX-like family ATPase